jgi:hypothetical protein
VRKRIATLSLVSGLVFCQQPPISLQGQNASAPKLATQEAALPLGQTGPAESGKLDVPVEFGLAMESASALDHWFAVPVVAQEILPKPTADAGPLEEEMWRHWDKVEPLKDKSKFWRDRGLPELSGQLLQQVISSSFRHLIRLSETQSNLKDITLLSGRPSIACAPISAASMLWTKC